MQNNDGLILGVFLAKRFNTHYSLSYYYLSEEVRRKPITLHFFLFCTKKLNPLFDIYIKKNKNYETYSRYFSATQDKEILKFSGLRDSTIDDKFIGVLEWAE